MTIYKYQIKDIFLKILGRYTQDINSTLYNFKLQIIEYLLSIMETNVAKIND